MKTGIYITGLGQSFANESVVKYATRMMNAMRDHTQGIAFELRSETIVYADEMESNVISVWADGEQGQREVYRIYDFKYHSILTERFNNYSLVVRNLLLFALVCRKFPLIIKRMFFPEDYSRPFQSFYIFSLFLIISTAVILMLPSTFAVLSEVATKPENVVKWQEFKQSLAAYEWLEPLSRDFPVLSLQMFDRANKLILAFTALLLIFIPRANVLLTNLATEFNCANDYLEFGTQKQKVLGNLDQLINHISEKDSDCELHFHSYSFGSIIALDYVFPYGNLPSGDARRLCKALITIGTPFEFIKSYYPGFYAERSKALDPQVRWINIYSIADALATNFRHDARTGEAEFGIDATAAKPVNINYEVANLGSISLLNYLMLYGIRVHGMYWDPTTEGRSCLGELIPAMEKMELLNLTIAHEVFD